ncbi:MAG: DUF1963 domain-containing protein, partial [Planctomycetaceae bacterium]|nr:DUF1963 domain-containing protein [Planctomycetaceae bacterium]
MTNHNLDVSSEMLGEWRAALPLSWSEMVELGCYGSGSPIGLLANCDLKAELSTRFPTVPTVPCDTFVLAIGEPPDRGATKFGGLPYRPAGAPWPMTADGKPYLFAFQFRFVESRDILPPLPGDVLLVFLKEEYIVTGEDDFIVFEWQNLTDAPLIRAEECIGAEWPYFFGYGLRWRSYDFVDVATIGAEYARMTELIGKRWENDYHQSLVERCAARFPGLKIGGLPTWRDEPTEGVSPGDIFLCGFGEIGPMSEVTYPFANRATPLSLGEALNPRYGLNWYDGFWLFFFLDATGNVHWG